MSAGWTGVDLDGTLAKHESGESVDHIGEPIPAMVERVRAWLAEGRVVKIMTARVSFSDAPDQIILIQDWCLKHLGAVLDITCTKDGAMKELWDDRAVGIVRNEGTLATDVAYVQGYIEGSAVALEKLAEQQADQEQRDQLIAAASKLREMKP